MSAAPPDEPPTPAEARLLALLALLTARADEDSGPAVRRLLLTVRWQRSLRLAFDAVGQLAGAMGVAVRTLLRSGR